MTDNGFAMHAHAHSCHYLDLLFLDALALLSPKPSGFFAQAIGLCTPLASLSPLQGENHQRLAEIHVPSARH